MKKYLPRIADKILRFKLESKGAVLIQGAKWCGKSTTAEQQAKSVIYMQDTQKQNQYIALAKTDVKLFLSGPTPKLIDEWQIIPFIWDSIRFEIDQRDEFGQFILTGSVTPQDTDKNVHSGIGRITRMTMRPMSLYESLDSNGTISISDLFNGKEKISSSSNVTVQDYAYLLCRGGWPKAINQKSQVALQQAIDYYDELVNSDISKVDGIKRDKERAKSILKSYARNVSQQAALSTIIKDISTNDTSIISDATVASYLSAFKKLFVIEDLAARNPNLRSKTAIRKQDTRHFVDPSIATAALGLGPMDLMYDLKTFGLLFESMAIRDLRIYAESLDGNVYHYRDKNGLEVDAVIHLRNSNYGLVEIKLATEESIEEGAKNLLKLANKIDLSKMKKPSFLMIITATSFAYTREDGIHVVPLACLKN